MLATFNDWGILDNVNKRAKTSGDQREPPRPGVFGGGAVARPPAPAPAPAPRPGAQQQNLQRVFPPGMQQSDVIAVCPNLQWLERFICTNRGSWRIFRFFLPAIASHAKVQLSSKNWHYCLALANADRFKVPGEDERRLVFDKTDVRKLYSVDPRFCAQRDFGTPYVPP